MTGRAVLTAIGLRAAQQCPHRRLEHCRRSSGQAAPDRSAPMQPAIRPEARQPRRPEAVTDDGLSWAALSHWFPCDGSCRLFLCKEKGLLLDIDVAIQVR